MAPEELTTLGAGVLADPNPWGFVVTRLHARYGSRVSPDRSALITPTGRAIGSVPKGWGLAGRLAIPPGGGSLVLPSGVPAVAEPVSPTLEAFVVHAVESRRQSGGSGGRQRPGSVTNVARPLAKLAFLGRDRAHLELGEKGIELRPRLAEILGIEASRCSVKATTTEGLGFTGRGEGIAAQAVATVRLPA